MNSTNLIIIEIMKQHTLVVTKYATSWVTELYGTFIYATEGSVLQYAAVCGLCLFMLANPTMFCEPYTSISMSQIADQVSLL